MTSRHKVVVFSGSGLSAESGLPTFRDANGLWRQHQWHDVASPIGWQRNPALVLEFYNERRAAAWDAQPNAAHRAIAELEQHFDVVIVTQNVDALHERAGSTQVIHVHGELAYARSTANPALRYHLGGAPIELGQCCEQGSQLRPDIVWFGEEPLFLLEARAHIADADKILVVGTSLSVYPAAGLVDFASAQAEKVLISLEMEALPPGYRFLRGKAGEQVPRLLAQWCAGAS